MHKLKTLLLFVSLLVSSCQPFRSSSNGEKRWDPYAEKTEVDVNPLKSGQPKKKILSFPLMNVTPFQGEDVGVFFSQRLLQEFRKSKFVILPTEQQLVPGSEDFYLNDKVKLPALMQAGKKLSVSLATIGRILQITIRRSGDDVGLFRKQKWFCTVDLEFKVFDLMNSREVYSVVKAASYEAPQYELLEHPDAVKPKELRLELVRKTLANAALQLAQDLEKHFERLLWQGQIIKISGNQIIINAGKASGLNLDDILRVLSPGQEVIDPRTNQFLGHSPGKPKGTIRIQQFLGADAAITSIHSGAQFQEGDVVELY